MFDPSVVETIGPVEVDEVGNHTYKMILCDDLYYSDGTPITAWDYAFSLLLMMSPEIEAIGGRPLPPVRQGAFPRTAGGRDRRRNGRGIIPLL